MVRRLTEKCPGTLPTVQDALLRGNPWYVRMKFWNAFAVIQIQRFYRRTGRIKFLCDAKEKMEKRKIGRLLEMHKAREMVYHAIAANPNRQVRAHQD